MLDFELISERIFVQMQTNTGHIALLETHFGRLYALPLLILLYTSAGGFWDQFNLGFIYLTGAFWSIASLVF